MADFPITVSTRGVESVPNLSSASARKCASLLQKNHENYHIFWNFKGFHNHHVHYMLTAWALGADTKQLQESFDSNVGYQRPKLPDDENLVAKLDENRHFESYLGNEAYFPVYTEFFKKKIAEDGEYHRILHVQNLEIDIVIGAGLEADIRLSFQKVFRKLSTIIFSPRAQSQRT